MPEAEVGSDVARLCCKFGKQHLCRLRFRLHNGQDLSFDETTRVPRLWRRGHRNRYPDPYRGRSAKAFIALKPGHPAFGIDELRAFFTDKLAKYEMPIEMEIVRACQDSRLESSPTIPDVSPKARGPRRAKLRYGGKSPHRGSIARLAVTMALWLITGPPSIGHTISAGITLSAWPALRHADRLGAVAWRTSRDVHRAGIGRWRVGNDRGAFRGRSTSASVRCSPVRRSILTLLSGQRVDLVDKREPSGYHLTVGRPSTFPSQSDKSPCTIRSLTRRRPLDGLFASNP